MLRVQIKGLEVGDEYLLFDDTKLRKEGRTCGVADLSIQSTPQRPRYVIPTSPNQEQQPYEQYNRNTEYQQQVNYENLISRGFNSSCDVKAEDYGIQL